jgi:KaiC/GvpD/RAD55 family RecA-like ATPase
MDAHGLLKAALVRGRYGAAKQGKVIAFRCFRHQDSHASAWLGDHAWGCAACGFTEKLDTLAEHLGVTLPERKGNGLPLAEYAERKGLNLNTLLSFGVHEIVGKYGEPLVAIPYRGADGTLIRTKVRTQKGTFWLKDGEGAPLYGQDRLAAAPKTEPVLIVEGESDCHAAWSRGICAVGLPGASQWRPEYALLLDGRDVIVWQEPDEGGATLVSAVAKSLPKAKVLANVTVPGEPTQIVKDFCDLHQIAQGNSLAFPALWSEVIAKATPIGAEGPIVAFDSISGETLKVLLDENLAPVDAVPTMLPMWNAICGGGGGKVGLARGWYITIGANTGTGKSLIGLNLSYHAALKGETVAFLSLEMGRSELATRLMAICSGEKVSELEKGPGFKVEAFQRAASYMDDLRRMTGGQVLVNRQPLSKLSDLVACMRYYRETHGAKFFVIDYIQLARTQDGHSIHERIELVSHKLRELTGQLGIVTVALSQFNRQTSAVRAERPVSQGLMGGSAVENDSHQVLLFDHSRFERKEWWADTWLIVDKNRHGSVLDIPVRWDYRTLRLEPRVPPPAVDGWSSRTHNPQGYKR